MDERKNNHINAQQEINLKLFFRKIYRYKFLFILSIGLIVTLAYIYTRLATSIYEVSSSILIDPSGSSRGLGESKYVEGGVSLIEMEKNLYNEIGIIKSFSLVKQTVEDLNFDISYYNENWLKKQEHYGYFPFVLSPIKTEPQIINAPFEIKFVGGDQYKLSVDIGSFKVMNPSNGSVHEVNKDFKYSGEYSFGEVVQHEYFNFVLNKPDYKVSPEDFEEPNFSFIIRNTDDVVNAYLSKLKVDNIDVQASIFKITSNGAVVDKEIDFLNKLTENYIQNKLVSRNKIAVNKEAFIRNQLAEITDSLMMVESSLESFKRNKNAVNLGAIAVNALDQTQNLQVEKAKIEMDVKYNKSLIDYIEDNRDSENFVIPVVTGIDDPMMDKNIAELKRLHAERSKKKFYVTSNNQEMNILDAQINESTESLLNDIRSVNNSSDFSLQRLREQIANYNGVISSLPTSEKQMLGIQRKSTLYENLFNYLSQELAKTAIAGAESTSDTRVLDEARMVGGKPIAPQSTLILIVAVIIGTIIPLVWMVLAPNDIIHNSSQITANTDLPVIANISYHDLKSKRKGSELSLWKVKESFRDLSANLRIILPKSGCCILGLTSILPGEGKTYCSINLAITFAEAGKKTIIIDTDLRDPSLVDGLKKVEGKGLSDFLEGDITNIKDIIYSHNKLSNLQFIPTSVARGNIHELLSGSRIKLLIQELKERYDYIILDTPAVGLVSDFLLMSDDIDIKLFVVRRKVAKIGFLEDLEKLVPHGKSKKGYILFNDTLEKTYKYGYGQKYGVNVEPQLVNESFSV